MKSKQNDSIASRFIKNNFIVSTIPLVILLFLILFSIESLSQLSQTFLKQSIADLSYTTKKSLRMLAEQEIKTIARKVAQQVAIYIQSHPDLTLKELQEDKYFKEIAVQKVGNTGYTSLHEAGTSICRFHINKTLIDKDLQFLAKKLPSFGKILSLSTEETVEDNEIKITANEVYGYYNWEESDGKNSRQFMVMTPVRLPVLQEGKLETLMVTASAYVNDFFSSVDSFKQKERAIHDEYERVLYEQKVWMLQLYALITLLITVLAYIIGRRNVKKIIHPIEELAFAVNRPQNIIKKDKLEIPYTNLPEEIKVLIYSFNKMSEELGNKLSRMEDFNLNMEKRVKEKTEKLNETIEQLNQAQEELLHTSRLAILGEMSGHVVHEVLNPLTGMLFQIQKKLEELSVEDKEIIGELNDVMNLWHRKFQKGELEPLLAQKKGDKQVGEQSFELIASYLRILSVERKELRERFKFLERGIHRIIDILNTFRDRGDKAKELEEIEMRKIIQECLRFISESLKKYNIELLEEYEPNLPKIYVNSGEIVEVFLNLFQNSIHAIRKISSHGTIKVAVKHKDKFLEVRVTDTGCGIPEENIKKIFEFGFTTRKTGSGFGLPICRRLIRSANGDIFLEQNEGQKETTFLITLPLKSAIQKKNDSKSVEIEL